MKPVVRDDKVLIHKLTLGAFDANSYIITCRQTRDSTIVDAPADAAEILKRLKWTHPKYILITHTHMDHLGAVFELKSKLGVPVAAHPLDARRLCSPPESLLGDGDGVSFGNLELEVLHTPGHTPGSLCFLTGKYLISGDTIFPGGPGWTQSPVDFSQIIESISSKIFVLPDDTRIFPGHGASTVLEKEKAEFALFSSRPHDAKLCGHVRWLSS